MDHTAIIKRAVTITRRYPALWLFGILVAVTGGGSGGGGGGGRNLSFDGSSGQEGMSGDFSWPEGWPGRAFVEQLASEIDAFDPSVLSPSVEGVAIVALLCGLLFVLVAVAVVVNLVGRAALMRLVDRLETSGRAPAVRDGFRLAWTGRTARLFVLDLVFLFLAVLLFFTVGLVIGLPVLALLAVEQAVAAIAVGIGLGLLGIPVFIVSVIVLDLVGRLYAREIVVAGTGLGDAVGRALALLGGARVAIAVMWLIMVVITIGFGVIMIPALLVTVPVALAAAAGVGALVFAAFDSALIALVAGIPVFIAVISVPIAILGGLFSVFESSVWTLTWREVSGRTAPAAPDPVAA